MRAAGHALSPAPLSPRAGASPLMRGETGIWLCLVLTFLGTLFPHVFARDFLDDASVVRWISVPVFLACAVLLGDKYVF